MRISFLAVFPALSVNSSATVCVPMDRGKSALQEGAPVMVPEMGSLP